MNRLQDFTEEYGDVYDYSDDNGSFNGRLRQVPKSDANRVEIERLRPDEVVRFEFLSVAYGSYGGWVENCHTRRSRPGLYEVFVR